MAQLHPLTEPPANTKSKAYRPELDVLRFIAFFMIFAHHTIPRFADQYPKKLPIVLREVFAAIGNSFGFGLGLFFILSAFLITDMLRREAVGSGTVHIKQFYIRRILRIWPLYFVGVGIGVSVALLQHNPAQAVMFGLYVVMLGNWYFASHAWSPNPMTPLWSVSIEEQYYLFWPLVMRFFSKRGALGVCALMLCVAFGTEIFLGIRHAAMDTQVWTNSFVQFQYFAVGAAIALVLDCNSPKLQGIHRIGLVFLGLVCWFVAAYFFHAKGKFDAESGQAVLVGYAFATLASAMVLVAFLGANARFPSWLIYLGRISYGLYVFHVLVLDSFPTTHSQLAYGARAVVGLLLTIVVAGISYRFMESPFLRLKERFSFISSRPV